MKYRIIFLSLLVGISFSTTLLASKSQPPSVKENVVVGIDEKVNGKYLHEYASMWWQWVNSMQRSESPVEDTVGDLCHVHQDGDI
jgi:hypothetical protein